MCIFYIMFMSVFHFVATDCSSINIYSNTVHFISPGPQVSEVWVQIQLTVKLFCCLSYDDDHLFLTHCDPMLKTSFESCLNLSLNSDDQH